MMIKTHKKLRKRRNYAQFCKKKNERILSKGETFFIKYLPVKTNQNDESKKTKCVCISKKLFNINFFFFFSH